MHGYSVDLCSYRQFSVLRRSYQYRQMSNYSVWQVDDTGEEPVRLLNKNIARPSNGILDASVDFQLILARIVFSARFFLSLIAVLICLEPGLLVTLILRIVSYC